MLNLIFIVLPFVNQHFFKKYVPVSLKSTFFVNALGFLGNFFFFALKYEKRVKSILKSNKIKSCARKVSSYTINNLNRVGID